MKRMLWGALLGAGLVALAAAHGTGQAQDPCASLKGTQIVATGIGLKTTGAEVKTAEPVAGQRPYCKITGAIHPVDKTAPDINFQVNLPATWNGKAVHFGGAGYDGSVVNGLGLPMAPPGVQPAIAQGYVTFGSDSGHSAGREPAAFGSNAEALANFGGDQLKKTHDVAMALVRQRYGKAPKRTYFVGGSQGGHEALIVIQRWPKDYDGAVVLYPVYNFTGVQTNGVQLGQIMYRSPAAWVSPAKTALVADAVMAACDGLDGAKDGLISNVAGCRVAFDPKSLLCAGGDGDRCLTREQLATLMAFDEERPLGVTLAGGVTSMPRWPVFEGANLAGRFGLGAAPSPGKPPSGNDAFIYYMGDQAMRHMALKDPAFDTLKFVPKDHAAALQTLSRQIDASNPDISAFKARGGKMLLLHGTVDTAVMPANTTAYYKRLQTRFGGGLKDFVRYYTVPGYGHGTGPFTVGWDALSVLDAWADKGAAPGPQTTVDLNPATAGRSRPLCEYPTWPKYVSGDQKSAASFSCSP